MSAADDVTALLTQSKAHHLAYLMEDRKAPNANYAYCEGEVAKALQCRQQAHDLDPQHTASIWRDDAARWPHAELIDFYLRYPGIE